MDLRNIDLINRYHKDCVKINEIRRRICLDYVIVLSIILCPNIINGKLVLSPDIELIDIVNTKEEYDINFHMVSSNGRFVLILGIDGKYYELQGRININKREVERLICKIVSDVNREINKLLANPF